MSTVQAERTSDSYALERTPREYDRLRNTAVSIERIRESAIGDDVLLEGSFGPRRLVYADYTASGRALSFVEDCIRQRVLPLYANTHTEASATGSYTTALREDARRIIHRAVGGGDEDVVIFCGSGSTAAIDTLIRVLELHRRERPVVFIGPYEHHSNELPWREAVSDVVTIREAADGRLDIDHLEHELRRYANRPCCGRFATPRCALLLGLRDGRAVPADRDGRQGRRVPLAAQVHRWPPPRGFR